MLTAALWKQNPLAPTKLARLPIYYGWVVLVMAAVAMTATLPGRTHGLGLIAKPLIDDPALKIDELRFTQMNFWAIIIGSALCLPIGRLIDRRGVRSVLIGVAFSLGVAVIWMSQAKDIAVLFISLTLIRGLGQGSLSVVSMAMVGKWFTRRLSMAMAVFTVLLSFGFIASVLIFGSAVAELGWRNAWANLGWCLLLGLAPLGWLLVRSSPESIGVAPDREEEAHERRSALALTLAEALRSPSFWAFTFAASLFNMAWSAIMLLNENLLATRGIDKETFVIVMAIMVSCGLPANFLGSWLTSRWGMSKVLAGGMAMMAGTLMFFPNIETKSHAFIYGAMLGVTGGIITVVWFAFYGAAFGRTHLGAIQAAAQTCSVFASALGPVLLAFCKQQTGSYDGFFHATMASALLFGVVLPFIKLPRRDLNSPASSEATILE